MPCYGDPGHITTLKLICVSLLVDIFACSVLVSKCAVHESTKRFELGEGCYFCTYSNVADAIEMDGHRRYLQFAPKGHVFRFLLTAVCISNEQSSSISEGLIAWNV